MTYLDQFMRYHGRERSVEAELRGQEIHDAISDAAKKPQPINGLAGFGNEFRPRRFDDVIGQQRVVTLLRRIVESTKRRADALDHMLFTGPSGTGKTTLAVTVANEMGVPIYEVKAPVAIDKLLELREVMIDRSILFVDEVHLQAMGDRRGRSADTQAEIFYGVMEDRAIVMGSETLAFPKITVIAGTTDEGMLPDAFFNRFPMPIGLDTYSREDMYEIGLLSARTLKLRVHKVALDFMAGASRANPRQMNSYLRNARALAHGDDVVDLGLATEVVRVLNQTENDGLTADMAKMLVFLFTRCRRVKGDGEVVYQAGMGTLATALGKSRDQKVVALRIEPTLIERGYLSVGHGGRLLTEAGVERARELLEREG